MVINLYNCINKFNQISHDGLIITAYVRALQVLIIGNAFFFRFGCTKSYVFYDWEIIEI